MILTSITLVGGTFDSYGGKPSSVVSKIASALALKVSHITVINGGHLDELKSFNCSTESLIWMPNVDNSEDKILPTLKDKYPQLLLVSSKRVIEKDYKESDIIGRLLKTKSNLGLVVRDSFGLYRFQVLDPLGNQYSNSGDIAEVSNALFTRMSFIYSLTRKPSVRVGDSQDHQVDPQFISIVQDYGTRFSSFINAVNPNRLLGNASTRCSFGFPGMRTGSSYFVSERNIDKSKMTSNNFVQVKTSESKVEYFGDKKPSVDTPIQIKIFNHFQNINYIIHGHVYVKGAPFTEHKLPCGAVEEIDELKALLAADTANVCVNLKGHGCLILAHDLAYFDNIELQARICPES